MPSCRVTNYTSQPLNVSLKHLCALHFHNEVAPGQTVKLKPGKVWFTLEVLVDDKKNQYSMAQSAAAIAIVSLAAIGTVATVGAPAIAAASGTTVAGALAAAGATALAVGETVATGFASTVGASHAFLMAHAGIAAKISAAFLPKALEVVEKEVGGFNAVQKEVVAILSSPTVTDDVRKEGLSILARLAAAIAADKKDSETAPEPSGSGSGKSTLSSPPPPYSEAPSNSSSNGTLRPSLKRAQTSVSTLLSKVSSESRLERKATKKEAKAAKQVASWEVVDFDADKEPTMLSSKEQLRIHGLFVNERKHFEVREKNGKLVLIDANTREQVAG